MAGGRSLVAGGWWLVAGGWWLVVGGWWLVAGGWWLVAGGWWLVVGSRPNRVLEVLQKTRVRRTQKWVPKINGFTYTIQLQDNMM